MLEIGFNLLALNQKLHAKGLSVTHHRMLQVMAELGAKEVNE